MLLSVKARPKSRVLQGAHSCQSICRSHFFARTLLLALYCSHSFGPGRRNLLRCLREGRELLASFSDPEVVSSDKFTRSTPQLLSRHCAPSMLCERSHGVAACDVTLLLDTSATLFANATADAVTPTAAIFSTDVVTAAHLATDDYLRRNLGTSLSNASA